MNLNQVLENKVCQNIEKEFLIWYTKKKKEKKKIFQTKFNFN